jgi:glycosidase
MCHNDKKKLETALALTMFMPGTPCIYYGTEHAMEGGYDPDCRRCFDWDKSKWDMKFLGRVKELIALRQNQILQRGDVFITEENGSIIVKRSYNGGVAILKISSPTVYTISFENNQGA